MSTGKLKSDVIKPIQNQITLIRLKCFFFFSNFSVPVWKVSATDQSQQEIQQNFKVMSTKFVNFLSPVGSV